MGDEDVRSDLGTGEGSGAGGGSVGPRFKGARRGCLMVSLGIVMLGMGSSGADGGSEVANDCEFGVVELVLSPSGA